MSYSVNVSTYWPTLMLSLEVYIYYYGKLYIVGQLDKEEPFNYIFGRFRRIVNSFPG